MNKLALLFSFVTMLVLAGCTKPLELPPHDEGFHFKHYQRVKVNANRFPWVGSEIDLKEGERVLVLASGKVTTCRHCGSDTDTFTCASVRARPFSASVAKLPE